MSTLTVNNNITILPIVSSTYDYKSAVNNLCDILEKFKDNSDRLSKKLFRWGASVLKTAKEQMNHEEKEIVEIARDRIHYLVHTILINPIDKSTLKDPVLERSWVWERWIHEDYKSLFSVSPFDGEAMTKNPPSHFFALAMLDWIRRFTPVNPIEVTTGNNVVLGHHTGHINQSQIAVLRNYPELAVTRRWIYQRLAQLTLSRERNEQMSEMMGDALIRVDQCMEEMKNMSVIAIVNQEQRDAEHEAALVRKFESIEKIYQETIAGLNDQLEWVRKIGRETIQTLEKQMTSMDQTNQSMIVTAKKQIQEVTQETAKTVSVLQQHINTVSEVHKGVVATLTAEKKACEAQISVLGKEVLDQSKTLHEVKQDLKQANEQNAKNSREIERLTINYANAQQKIVNLEEEVDDLDDSFCIIS